jgi:ribosomal protein S18 acetylase RimI-like enzyme
MPSDSPVHVLDNPGWYTLNTHHARFALGTSLAKRYPPEKGGLIALVDHGEAALHDMEQLVSPGEHVYLIEVQPPIDIPGWTIHQIIELTQMISEQSLPQINDSSAITELTLADEPDIAQLVDLTRPGPWITGFMELGRFFGIRQDHQLVAMAGTRLHPNGYREIVTVCTHPDYQGKGYAALLVSHLVNIIQEANEVPFLHVFPGNTRAINLYKRLHFHERCIMQVAIISR